MQLLTLLLLKNENKLKRFKEEEFVNNNTFVTTTIRVMAYICQESYPMSYGKYVKF